MNRTIKVLCCGSSMEGGGSERQLLYLMRGLDRSQFQVWLYLLYQSGALIDDVPSDIAVRSFWTGRQMPKLNWPGRFHGQQVRELASHIRHIEADLVYDRLFHMTMITGPAARRARIARVSCIVSPPSRDVMRSELKLVWLKRWMLAKAYASSDRLIAVSSATADDSAHFYNIPREKFSVVPSAVDIHRIDILAQEASLNLDWDQHAKHIIAIGRMSDEKGHQALIDAFARLVSNMESQPCYLHLVGDGPLRSALQEQVERLRLAPWVHFHGHLSNPYSILAKCDLLVLPSLYEGMPNVVIEAMACRVPVIATATAGAAGELLGNGLRGELVARPDATLIADAMRDRFQNPSRWLARIEPARQYVELTHALPRWLEQMQSIFHDVVAHRRRR